MIEGKGFYTGYNIDDFTGEEPDLENVFEHGEIKNGKRIGEWSGVINKKDSLTFTENYSNGKLVSGQSKERNGKIFKYSHREVSPEYKGGIERFYTYLGHEIVYPELAKKLGVQGKVIIQFVIEKNGSVTNLKVFRSPSNDLAAEAMRVIKKSKEWQPGYQFGRPVRVIYTEPINFSLD